MKILLTQLATYHLWANKLLIDRILQLPEAVQQKELPGSFPGLSKTLLHMLDAESIWWQRMKLLEQVVRPSENFTGNCAAIAKALMQQSTQWQQWVLAAQPHMLDHEFIYQNNKKEKFKQPVFQVLTHIFNHGTYHRGQLVSLLRQLEVNNIPATDFIVWSRKKELKIKN